MSFYNDFKGLEEVEINGKTFIDKKQLLELIKDEKKRWMDGTEPGYFSKKEKQRISSMLSLNKLAVLINKRFYDELNEDMGKYLVVTFTDNTLYYFKEWVQPRSKNENPMFTLNPNEAEKFISLEDAMKVVHKVNDDCPWLDSVAVPFGWTFSKSGLRHIHALLGWPEDSDPEAILEKELSFRRIPG